jgi:hypothetical protein
MLTVDVGGSWLQPAGGVVGEVDCGLQRWPHDAGPHTPHCAWQSRTLGMQLQEAAALCGNQTPTSHTKSVTHIVHGCWLDSTCRQGVRHWPAPHTATADLEPFKARNDCTCNLCVSAAAMSPFLAAAAASMRFTAAAIPPLAAATMGIACCSCRPVSPPCHPGQQC